MANLVTAAGELSISDRRFNGFCMPGACCEFPD
jgi:hypothetical protein